LCSNDKNMWVKGGPEGVLALGPVRANGCKPRQQGI